VTLGRVIPILRSFDEAKARRFYVDFLGFKVDWEHRFEERLPLYMQISKDDCILHLSEHHGDCRAPGALRIATSNVKAYQRELIANSDNYARRCAERKPWGKISMSISDPFGTRLEFYQPK
jgi:uncharacterized glyoxalase superfamily protein PhnB